PIRHSLSASSSITRRRQEHLLLPQLLQIRQPSSYTSASSPHWAQVLPSTLVPCGINLFSARITPFFQVFRESSFKWRLSTICTTSINGIPCRNTPLISLA